MIKFSAVIKIMIITILISKLSLLNAEIKTYPNPWIPEDTKLKTGNLQDGITFEGLTENGEIMIYTITGELIRKVEFENNKEGKLQLFGSNDDTQLLTSGIYIWKVKTSEQVYSGKIIVIR